MKIFKNKAALTNARVPPDEQIAFLLSWKSANIKLSAGMIKNVNFTVY